MLNIFQRRRCLACKHMQTQCKGTGDKTTFWQTRVQCAKVPQTLCRKLRKSRLLVRSTQAHQRRACGMYSTWMTFGWMTRKAWSDMNIRGLDMDWAELYQWIPMIPVLKLPKSSQPLPWRGSPRDPHPPPKKGIFSKYLLKMWEVFEICATRLK